MAKTIGKRHITVFGVDKQLAKKSKRFGIKCVPGWSGDVLEKLGKQKFDIIYLDYCGTPDGNALFNPLEDMDRASTMLTRGGVLACTFSKRCSNIASKCLNMAPSPLTLRRTLEYCDSAAMIFAVYSTRNVPMVGPPVGSIVRVQKWVGRVDQVYLDGVGLTLMMKKNKKWVEDKSDQAAWDEPFAKIKIIEMPAKKVVRHIAKSASCNTKKPKNMTVAKELFKEWFAECIQTGDINATRSEPRRHWLQKGAALQHYKSWCDAKGLPWAHCLSDRCKNECKAKKCPVNTCPRFLVHMCDAVGYEHYVKRDGLHVREALKKGQGNEAIYCYRAYFKDGKANVLQLGGTAKKGRAPVTLVKKAEYIYEHWKNWKPTAKQKKDSPAKDRVEPGLKSMKKWLEKHTELITDLDANRDKAAKPNEASKAYKHYVMSGDYNEDIGKPRGDCMNRYRLLMPLKGNTETFKKVLNSKVSTKLKNKWISGTSRKRYPFRLV